MDYGTFFSSLMTYFWGLLSFAGGIVAAIGIFRWVQGGQAHDAQQQQGAVWMIALGGAMVAIGVFGGANLQFPTL